MQNSISHWNLDDFEIPPLQERLWNQLDKLTDNKAAKELAFYRIITAFRDELALHEEDWKQRYFINT